MKSNRIEVKTYKDLYFALKECVPSEVVVVDRHEIGFCISGFFCTAIYVNPSLSWKKRIYVLAHEIGHCCYMRKCRIIKSQAKDLANEKIANKRAISILKKMGLDCEKDFYEFYNEKTGEKNEEGSKN